MNIWDTENAVAPPLGRGDINTEFERRVLRDGRALAMGSEPVFTPPQALGGDGWQEPIETSHALGFRWEEGAPSYEDGLQDRQALVAGPEPVFAPAQALSSEGWREEPIEMWHAFDARWSELPLIKPYDELESPGILHEGSAVAAERDAQLCMTHDNSGGSLGAPPAIGIPNVGLDNPVGHPYVPQWPNWQPSPGPHQGNWTEDVTSYNGRRAVHRFTPYQRQHRDGADSEQQWGLDTTYRPRVPASSLIHTLDERLITFPSNQDGASPKKSTGENPYSKATYSEATSAFSLPSPPDSTMSANSPSSSSVNSERTRKQDADNKRGKETHEARARFKTLFPRARTNLKAAEAAVLVCKHMKLEGSVPRVADNVEGLRQLLKGEKAAVGAALTGASPEPNDENDDGEARRKGKKKEADKVRNEAWKKLNKELRELFEQSGTNLDAWQTAYDFLVYGMEQKVVPDLINIPYKQWRGECGLVNTSRSFFDEA